MEYIKYIQDLEGVSRPVKDAELTDEVNNLNVEVNDLTVEVNNMQTDMQTVTEITLTASGWSSSSPYSQTVNVSGVTADSVFDVGILYPSNCTRSNQKAISKAAALIYEITSQSGAVRFRATEKPSTDIPLGLKGVM